jgi:hypothetical protein
MRVDIFRGTARYMIASVAASTTQIWNNYFARRIVGVDWQARQTRCMSAGLMAQT